jgi:hypothetical protein
MAAESPTAQLAVWLPAFLLGNVVAALFLLQTFFLAFPGFDRALRRLWRGRDGRVRLPAALISAPGGPPEAPGPAKPPVRPTVVVVAGPCACGADGDGEGCRCAEGRPVLAWEGVGVREAAEGKWLVRDAWGQATAGELQVRALAGRRAGDRRAVAWAGRQGCGVRRRLRSAGAASSRPAA